MKAVRRKGHFMNGLARQVNALFPPPAYTPRPRRRHRPWRSLDERVARAHCHEVIRLQEAEAAIGGQRADEGEPMGLEARMEGRGMSGNAVETKLKKIFI